MHPSPIRVLALAGSLRRDSYNRRLLEAAVDLAPPGMSVSVHDTIADIPLFNEDLEAQAADGLAGVQRLRKAVAAADGVLIATPEYNQSLPGVLKNTIDWLSRPGIDGIEVLDAKPVAIVGATPGAWGTRLAQSQLRHALAATGSRTMPAPMLFVNGATHRVDPGTKGKLRAVLQAFNAWITLYNLR